VLDDTQSSNTKFGTKIMPEGSTMAKQVFLSHASDDKERYVRPLAQKLEEKGITYWLDEAEIRWGDKIGQKINEGLKQASFIVVFLTQTFIGRNWTETELSAALNRENDEGCVVVLPIVVGEPKDILANYPLLRDKSYQRWDSGLDRLVEELKNRVVLSRRGERIVEVPGVPSDPEKNRNEHPSSPPSLIPPAGSLPMCIEMELPSLIRTDPKYWPRNEPPIDASDVLYARTWPSRVWLRVRFMDGTPDIQEAVSSLAEEWVSATSQSIHFAFGDFPEAEIRISFSTEYLWSYVGTDALFVPPDKPTLCLGAIAVETDYETIRKAVLHEFGHVLGLIHTPQYPYAGEPAHLGKGFNDYFMAAVKGHFRSEIHQNNVRDLVRKQSFRVTRYDLVDDPQAIMRAHVPSGYASNRNGNDTFVDVWLMSSTISQNEEKLLRARYLDGSLRSDIPFGLLTSEPPGSGSKFDAS
jgi:hypothetical protein